jgi:glycosyltransferase involved in cell wall biosynthesis
MKPINDIILLNKNPYNDANGAQLYHEIFNRFKNENKIIVSIVVPIYNREHFITKAYAETFNALLGDNQTIEIIFVDDCSTDKTKEKIESHKHFFRHKVQVVSRVSNGGPGAARNSGISQAQGDYVYFIDSDATLFPDTLVSLMYPFGRDERVMFSGGSQHNYNPITVFDVWRNSRILRYPKGIVISTGINAYTLTPRDTANLLCKKEIFSTPKYMFDEAYTFGYEDMDLVLRLKLDGFYGAYVPHYVQNIRSITINDFISMLENRGRGSDYFREKHHEVLAIHEVVFSYFVRKSFLYCFAAMLKRILFPRRGISRSVEFLNEIWMYFTARNIIYLEKYSAKPKKS